MVQRSLTVPRTSELQQMHLFMVHMWCFSKRRRSGASKVHDARINIVDPLAPGSSRKQYSKNKEMLIFNLVSRYAQIPDKQNYPHGKRQFFRNFFEKILLSVKKTIVFSKEKRHVSPNQNCFFCWLKQLVKYYKQHGHCLHSSNIRC